jgi:hypothetical protein
MVTIRVLSRSGNPVKYATVTIVWSGGIFGTTSSEHTDDNGYATFSVGTGEGTIYVDGQTMYQGHVSGSSIVYGIY